MINDSEFLPIGTHNILKFKLLLEKNILYVAIDNNINKFYKLSDENILNKKMNLYTYNKIIDYQFTKCTKFFPRLYTYNKHIDLINQINIDLYNLVRML